MKTTVLAAASILTAFAVIFPLPVRADYVLLKDGNVIELKDVHGAVIPNGSRGNNTVGVEGTDEKGDKRQFESQDLLDPTTITNSVLKQKTSWETRADNQKWYDDRALKIAETWQAQFDFARSCKDKAMYDEALFHYKKSYDLRAATPLDKSETEEQRHRTLAVFLERECGLLDEANNEYAKIYELIKDQPRDSEQHRKFAIWCVEHDLPDAADTQYKAAIASAGDTRLLVKEYAQFQRSLIIPLNRQMYQQLQPNIEAACKYLRNNEFLNADGSMGKDATEAGVQTIRGMTAMTAEALLCEWDLKFFKDPESAGTPPKEVTNALNYLLSNKDHNRKMGNDFAGLDLWGPALTLEFLVRAYSRPYLIDRREEISKGIAVALDDLKNLQRDDGGWNYYNFISNSCSFLSSVILVNIEAAKNVGVPVDTQMVDSARKYIESAKFGEGTYKYSVEKYEEKGTNRSFSAVGACSRSPLCELAVMSAGGGSQASMQRAITNFFGGHDFLNKLRGLKTTHTGQGRTAPYYFMFSHYWTSRCIKQLPRQYRSNLQNFMARFIVASQDPEGTFHDFTGTKAYKLYATALGVLAMHELISGEADIAFTPLKLAKFEATFAPHSPSDPVPADKAKKIDAIAPSKNDKK
jgi:hypothetical protein